MATAIGTYAELASVKVRLGIDVGDVADDAELTKFCNWVNGWIENKTGRVLAPLPGGGPFLFDGHDALEDGRLLAVPNGILAITVLEVALYTGGGFNAIPATDFFLRPTAQERDPGWPATELWMTDLPSAGNAAPYFPRGFANIRITGPAGGTLGWPAEPDEIVAIAEKITVLGWRAKGASSADEVGSDGIGQVARSVLDGRDWHTLGRYTAKSVEIV